VWVCICVGVCMYGRVYVWVCVCVCVGFVKCGCVYVWVLWSVGVLVICVLLFTVLYFCNFFVLFRFNSYLFCLYILVKEFCHRETTQLQLVIIITIIIIIISLFPSFWHGEIEVLFSTRVGITKLQSYFSKYPINSFTTCVLRVLRISVILEFITVIIIGAGYKSWSSSSCSLLHSPVTSSLLGPNIYLSMILSNILCHCGFWMGEVKFHTHSKQKAACEYKTAPAQRRSLVNVQMYARAVM
jgi:hypothetical protein